MLKLRVIAINQTVITLHDGTEVYFSYETPVMVDSVREGVLITNQKFSATTSKHIRQWIKNWHGWRTMINVPHARILEFVEGVEVKAVPKVPSSKEKYPLAQDVIAQVDALALEMRNMSQLEQERVMMNLFRKLQEMEVKP